MMSTEIKIEKRKVVSITTLLGELGGMWSSLAFLCFVMIRILSPNRLLYSHIQNLYHLDVNLSDNSKNAHN